MLGTLRLLLALAVAASHANFRVAGLNPGVIAVIGFYLISGYVMSGLIQRHYSDAAQAPAFYLDRAVRLLPQYLFYAGITLAWHLQSGLSIPFLSHIPSPADLANNLLIVPLNYYMFNGSDQYTLVPPAWSLGAEVQFYLLVPLLLMRPGRMLAVGLFSFCVYLSALGGVIDSDWFGYRLLPGVLLFFLLGAWLQQQHHQKQRLRAIVMTVGVSGMAALAICVLSLGGTLHQPYNFETLLGAIIGLAMLQALAARPRTRWDETAGDLSYGVFLSHFLILWTVFPQGVGIGQLPGFLTLCIVASWISQRLVEQPLLKLRHRFRKSPGPTTS